MQLLEGYPLLQAATEQGCELDACVRAGSYWMRLSEDGSTVAAVYCGASLHDAAQQLEQLMLLAALGAYDGHNCDCEHCEQTRN